MRTRLGLVSTWTAVAALAVMQGLLQAGPDVPLPSNIPPGPGPAGGRLRPGRRRQAARATGVK